MAPFGAVLGPLLLLLSRAEPSLSPLPLLSLGSSPPPSVAFSPMEGRVNGLLAPASQPSSSFFFFF